MTMRYRFVLLPLGIACAVAVTAGQAPPTVDAPPYVASIKPPDPSFPFSRIMMQPGAITAQNVPVQMLLRQAFQVQADQIVGAPEWLQAARFDINVRIEGTPGPGVMPAVLRALLSDRFKLTTHRETRELPVYALMLARSDGRLGPQLTPSTLGCSPAGRGRGGSGPGGPPPPGPPAPGERRCGGWGGLGTLSVGGSPISQLLPQLSQMTGRTVIDRTGLTGNFDLDLAWAPDPGQLPQGPPPPGAPPLPAIDPNAPSLFTALQEQLGLKLESQRAPVEVVVIDRIERPTED
jgi:uncharacterized protein (TIGR03435 family)